MLGREHWGLSGVEGGLLCSSSSSEDVQRNGDTSFLEGGRIGIIGLESSDDCGGSCEGPSLGG